MSATNNNEPELNIRRWLGPRYWPLWFSFGLLRLFSLLPLSWLEKIGGFFGWMLYRLVPSRRRITRINIKQAYPDYSDEQVKQLIKASYKNLGIAPFEMAIAWWANRDNLRSITHIEGMEHLQKARDKGHGVILLTGHFTTLEIGGILLAAFTPLLAIYKKAHNPMFNHFMHYYRDKHIVRALPNTSVRAFIKGLKNKEAVWYAPDQDFGDQDIVFTPFLGGVASTLTSTARLAEMTGAAIVPYYPQRLGHGKGYRLVIEPELEDFPSGDLLEDSARINQAIESMVRKNPEEYTWIHKRFKQRPQGTPSIYP